MYHVYGYDLDSGETCLLHSLHTEREAIDWAKKYTFRDMGGWDKICVQYEREYDIGVAEEVIVWSVYNEPMPWSDNAHEEF
jgi:hypothetical protein